ncbi:MAG TPA: metallophosphoesterase [Marmoricola sp.]|jgi:Icc-related predicted phosphoesterase|nr:metallophosphoesterase [Marmoricola sp.]
MVRVLAIADEVNGNLGPRAMRDLAPELVLSAGDLPWDFLEEVAAEVGVPVLYVPGNHDPAPDPNRRGPVGATCVDGRVVVAAGVRVAGLGGCVRYRSGPYQYTQAEYADRVRRLRRAVTDATPVDVVLTHAPPRDLGDGPDGPHQGIDALHDLLSDLAPTWLLHGHVHPYEGHRPDRVLGTTTVRNVVPWSLLEVSR